MVLATERLILDTWEPSDLAGFQPIARDPEVMRYITGGIPWTEERIQDFVNRQIELYRTRSLDERRAIVGLQPKRADVILAGACIVKTVMDKLRKDSLTVSDRGLRHGLLIDRFGSSTSLRG